MKVSAYILMLYYLKCPIHFLLWSHETNAVSIKAESRPNPQQWEQQQEKYTCLHDVWKNLYVQNLVQPVSIPGTEEAGNELTRITWSHDHQKCFMWLYYVKMILYARMMKTQSVFDPLVKMIKSSHLFCTVLIFMIAYCVMWWWPIYLYTYA